MKFFRGDQAAPPAPFTFRDSDAGLRVERALKAGGGQVYLRIYQAA